MADVTASRYGYRGYVTSRPFMGERAPQHIQNLVIRDYANRHNLNYLLSAAEYAMCGSQMMLDQLIAELPSLEGLICYSIFQLPVLTPSRQKLYGAILDAGGELHAAVEGFAIKNQQDVQPIEDIWRTRLILSHCPTAREFLH